MGKKLNPGLSPTYTVLDPAQPNCLDLVFLPVLVSLNYEYVTEQLRLDGVVDRAD